eukprot:2926007-Ditylum_brightwellii.AAC.1
MEDPEMEINGHIDCIFFATSLWARIALFLVCLKFIEVGVIPSNQGGTRISPWAHGDEFVGLFSTWHQDHTVKKGKFHYMLLINANVTLPF